MSVDPFLTLHGAVVSESTDEMHSAPSHYGSPLVEQRELDAGNAIVSLSHRGIVTVSGEDRLSWLHSMTSQGLLGLQPGESIESMVLNPQGRIEHVLRLVDDGERAWLLVDEGSAPSLTEYLQRMRFAMRVEVTNVSDDYAAVLAFDGGRAVAALRGLDAAVVEWRDPWARVTSGGIQYARGEHPAAKWSVVQFVFRRTDLQAVARLVGAETADLRAAGLSSLDALEVRAWRPTRHSEVDDRSIPHELDWLRTAVHLNKGCYRGQETVAKVHNLGHPPRRLAMLHLEGSGGELPVKGALVRIAGGEADSRPVGRITRAVLHHEWGGIALVLLKRSVPEDAELEVRLGDVDDAERSGEWILATQEAIVPSDAGKSRDVPRLKRL